MDRIFSSWEIRYCKSFSGIEFLREKLSESLLKNHYRKIEKVKKNDI